MAQPYTFTARIEAAERGGAYVTVPFDVEAAFGKKRVPIQATFDGMPYRGTLVRMGGPSHILVIRKVIREQLGKAPGDAVAVTLVEDTTPRTVVVPDDVQQALAAHPQAAAFFNTLSYTHRKEYIQWITGAKRPDTRTRRMAQMMVMLAEGRRSR